MVGDLSEHGFARVDRIGVDVVEEDAQNVSQLTLCTRLSEIVEAGNIVETSAKCISENLEFVAILVNVDRAGEFEDDLRGAVKM